MISDHDAGFSPGTPSTHSNTLTLLILGVRSPKVNAASSMWSAMNHIKVLIRKAPKKQTAKFRKTFNINCIMLKNQRLEGKNCRSRVVGFG